MAEYVVNYDGFFTVTANNMQEAEQKANEYLSNADLMNDGADGEWYLGEIDEV